MTSPPTDDASSFPTNDSSSNEDPFTSDQLIARLRAADPIAPPTLPSATDPAAKRILELAMTNSPGHQSPADKLPDTQNPTPFGPPPIQAPAAGGARTSRRWGQLAAAAAAVLILVMGVVVLFPSNTEPALAAVHNAAETTADIDTGRATTTFTASGDDGSATEQAGGVATLTFAERNLSFTIDFTDIPDLGADVNDPLLTGLEGRLVDDVFYAQFDGEWVAIEAPAVLTNMAIDIADPRKILLTAQELLETEDLGSTTVDGVNVTHYRSVVDLGDDTVGQAGWLGGLENQLDLEADGEITVDLYVDDSGLMYRIDVVGDLVEPEGPSNAAFEISTVFTDLGADLTIEAPAGVEILDLGDFGIDEDD